MVAITPASGYVTPAGSIIIGLVAGAVCYQACRLRLRTRIDDALDVWGVHGVGGTWGAIATGLFATVAMNSAGADGLFYGNPSQVGVQLLAVLVSSVYSFGLTFVLLKVLGLAVDEKEEAIGLDLSQHGELAYQLNHVQRLIE